MRITAQLIVLLAIPLWSALAQPIDESALQDGELEDVPTTLLPLLKPDPAEVGDKLFQWKPRWGPTQLDPNSCWIVMLRALLEMSLQDTSAPAKDEVKQYIYDDFPKVVVTLQIMRDLGRVPLTYPYAAAQIAMQRMSQDSKFQYLTAYLIQKKIPVVMIMVHPGPPSEGEDRTLTSLRVREDVIKRDSQDDTALALASPYPGFALASVSKVPTPPEPIRNWISFEGEELGRENLFGAVMAAFTQLAGRNAAWELDPDIRSDASPFKSFLFITPWKKPITMQPPMFLNWHAAYASLDIAEKAVEQNKFTEAKVLVEAAWMWGSDLKKVGKIFVTKKMLPPGPSLEASPIGTS